jgi:uncharacterized membrane protein YfcA
VSPLLQLLALTAAVLLGATTQRVTGLGFALVSSPLLVLVLGPFQGVLLSNLLSLVANLVVLTMTWRMVQVRRALTLAVPALLLVPPGALVARALPAPVLQVVVGALVIVGMLLARYGGRWFAVRGTAGALAAGAASGFMNATAGVGGPALALYAMGSRWEHRRFVASAQLYFAVLNVGSVLAKGLPSVGAGRLLSALLALGVGISIGQRLTARVRPASAMRAVVALSVAGAAATVLKGALAW